MEESRGEGNGLGSRSTFNGPGGSIGGIDEGSEGKGGRRLG